MVTQALWGPLAAEDVATPHLPLLRPLVTAEVRGAARGHLRGHA